MLQDRPKLIGELRYLSLYFIVMKTYTTHVNDQGHLILPPEAAQHLGLIPGAAVTIEGEENQLSILRPITSLNRIYIEITNKCNLSCSTCMRNVWDVESGSMGMERFEGILADIEAFSPKPEIFLGGYGEPLSNPNCISMIERAKSKGIAVSLITNGILLSEEISKKLIELELDMLWVSLDGASPECYADVRLGNEFPSVIENLKHLRSARWRSFGGSPWAGAPRLGIAFVAMRRNIHDLVEVVKLSTRLGAVEISISNVLAHNDSLRDDILYNRSTNQVDSRQIQNWKPLIHMPRMDVNTRTAEMLTAILKSTHQIDFFGGKLDQNVGRCPFVERGSPSIRWDGKVSPCLPLLYTHSYYLEDRECCATAHIVGDLAKNSLLEIWSDPDYLALRERLQRFDFSPCTYCNCCELAGDNQDDCLGNTSPACGGCLWAQGLIRCP